MLVLHCVGCAILVLGLEAWAVRTGVKLTSNTRNNCRRTWHRCIIYTHGECMWGAAIVGCYLLLLQIVKQCTSQFVSTTSAAFVAALVDQHHCEFKRCYPGVPLTLTSALHVCCESICAWHNPKIALSVSSCTVHMENYSAKLFQVPFHSVPCFLPSH